MLSNTSDYTPDCIKNTNSEAHIPTEISNVSHADIESNNLASSKGKSIKERYNDFFSKRDINKKKAYSKAVYTGWTLALLGGVITLLCAAMWQLSGSKGVAFIVITSLIGFAGGFFIVGGICIIMTVPTSEFDIDQANRRNALMGKIFCFFFGLAALFYAFAATLCPPRTGVIMWPVVCYVWSHIFFPDRTTDDKLDTDYWRLLSTKINSIFVACPIPVYSALFMIAFSPIQWAKDGGKSFSNVYMDFAILLRDKQPISTIYYTLMAATFLGFNLNLMRLLYMQFLEFSEKSKDKNYDATSLVYVGWISLIFPSAVIQLGNWIAFGPLGLSPRSVDSWTNGIIGLALMVPFVIYFGFGKVLMGYWARRFELDVKQLFDDGAIMAELAASSNIIDEESNVYWIKRCKEQEALKPTQAYISRDFWIKGTIGINDLHKDGTLTIVVDIKDDCDPAWGMTFSNTALKREHIKIEHKHLKEAENNFQKRYFENFNTPEEKLSDGIQIIESNDVSKSIVTIKMVLKAKQTSKEKLLEWAIENLRLFKWKKEYENGALFSELLKKSPRELKTKDEKEECFNYSEKHPVTIDNYNNFVKIDFFISHSWNDSGDLKVSLLRQFAKEFMAKNNKRCPTFWLDKVCIDQSNPDDAIATLPITIGACTNFLILLSPTYLTRLWCVWELLTLFTFCNQQIALERIKILPICKDKEEFNSLLSQFENFDWNKAHCFDPNEEYKLRQIMNNVGMDRLVKSMKEIKSIIEKSQQLETSNLPSFLCCSRKHSVAPHDMKDSHY